MKINIAYGADWNGNGTMKLRIINTELGFNIGCLSECPEDAYLERDLSFVYDIPDMIKAAYEAGKKGEPLDFEVTDESEDKQ